MASLLAIINGLAFIFYGILCLTTDHMTKEFDRYKLARFRRVTGYLELFGGLGCVIGYYYHTPLYLFSCLGLALLMTIGSLVRFKVKDPIFLTVPAIVLGIVNYYLVYMRLIM